MIIGLNETTKKIYIFKLNIQVYSSNQSPTSNFWGCKDEIDSLVEKVFLSLKQYYY